jgi:hypothetical protein
MATPYFYILHWLPNANNNLPHDAYYAGVRYSKNCHPNDLLNTYFTSSLRVHWFLEKYGLPDEAETRVMESRESALAYEHEFLTEKDAAHSPYWLNLWNGGNTIPVKSDFSKKALAKQRREEREKRRQEYCRQSPWLNSPQWAIDRFIKESRERGTDTPKARYKRCAQRAAYIFQRHQKSQRNSSNGDSSKNFPTNSNNWNLDINHTPRHNDIIPQITLAACNSLHYIPSTRDYPWGHPT